MKQSVVKHSHLFILSDTPIFSGGLAALLTELSASYVIHILPFSHQQLWTSQPYAHDDIILFDVAVSSFEMRFAQLTSIRKNTPTCKILAMGRELNTSAIKELIALGINGYISKEDKLSTLNEAIEALKEGLHYFPAHIERGDTTPTQPTSTLPTRELQVLTAISQGLNNPEIAEKLFISVHTVQTYRKRLFKRFNVKRVAALIQVTTSFGLS